MHYWLSISLGMIATPFAIQYAYQDRGRLAFGGEYLVLPAMVMGAYLLRQVVPAILEMVYELIYGEEEPEDDTSGNRNNRTGNVADYRRVQRQTGIADEVVDRIIEHSFRKMELVQAPPNTFCCYCRTN